MENLQSILQSLYRVRSGQKNHRMYPEQFRRSPGNPKSSSHRNDPSNKGPIYFDSETLQKMIATFGPVEFSQFTVQHPLNDFDFSGSSSQDVFDPSASWHSSDWCTHQVNHLNNLESLHENLIKKLKEFPDNRSKKKNVTPRVEAPSSNDPRFLLNQVKAENEQNDNKSATKQKQFLTNWFDQHISKQLESRRNVNKSKTIGVDPALANLKSKHGMNLMRGASTRTNAGGKADLEFAKQLCSKTPDFQICQNQSHENDN